MQSTVSCLPCKPLLMSLGYLEVFSCPPLGTKGGYSAPLYPIIRPPLWPMYCHRQEASQDLWGMHYNTTACTSTKWGRLYILGQCFRAHCDKMDSLCIHTNTILCVSPVESGVCVWIMSTSSECLWFWWWCVYIQRLVEDWPMPCSHSAELMYLFGSING